LTIDQLEWFIERVPTIGATIWKGGFERDVSDCHALTYRLLLNNARCLRAR
jgi:hypothetical protein